MMQTKPIVAFKSMHSHLGTLLGDSFRFSFPLPARRENEVRWIVFACPQQVLGSVGTQVFPPTQLAEFRISDSEFIGIEAVTPRWFMQDDLPEKSLGTAEMPKGISFDEFIKLRSELLNSYELLVPAFIKKARDLTEQEAAAAKLFVARFEIIQEPILSNYYTHVGREFRTWMAQAEG